jgi:hypothetical protein
MKLIKYSTLTDKQKAAITTIIGLKNGIPTTYAEQREGLDWNIMQNKDNTRLSKKQKLITISIQDSLEEVIAFCNQNKLAPYCIIDKGINAQLKKELTERKKDRREHPRKKAILSGKFYNKRTKHRGRLYTMDISFKGCKFTYKSKHIIALGDTLEIIFALDNAQKTEITREVKAVYINEKQVGAEMINPPNLDPDLGFYLLQ